MTRGNEDGDCTDCGEPIWWESGDLGDRLVTQSGNRWCFGRNDSHVGMDYHHALPGMAQWRAQAPLGQVCRCLDRKDPPIHQIIDVPSEGTVSDQMALDSIARLLHERIGDGRLLAIAINVSRTGRNTGWNL